MSNPIEPNPQVVEAWLNAIKDQLPLLDEALAKKDWYEVKRRLNYIHLDAKDGRDYLYRCEGL